MPIHNIAQLVSDWESTNTSSRIGFGCPYLALPEVKAQLQDLYEITVNDLGWIYEVFLTPKPIALD